MGLIKAHMVMSLDGFIADPNDGVEHLFGWYSDGDVETPSNDERWTFKTTPESAELLSELMRSVGALICGRRLYDLTDGWGGNHPLGVPVYVVTHHPPADPPETKAPFTFVTDVATAVEQARSTAGERDVVVASASMAQQLLDAGLLDVISVSLVPVLLGDGIPFFAHLAKAPVKLDDPEVVATKGVTHLTYRVTR